MILRLERGVKLSVVLPDGYEYRCGSHKNVDSDYGHVALPEQFERKIDSNAIKQCLATVQT